uniref:Uncharacterized protein n=1 Tax=Anguilla anguilla TaxID=7936 RepID=A0A0E9V7B6_ANGAN
MLVDGTMMLQSVLGSSVATSSGGTSLTTFLSSVVFSESNSFSVVKLFY